jgi:hypothetical protein
MKKFQSWSTLCLIPLLVAVATPCFAANNQIVKYDANGNPIGSAVYESGGNVFLPVSSQLVFWPDPSGSYISGTGTGLNLYGKGGVITLQNADTMINGYGTTGCTVTGAGNTNATSALLVRNSASVPLIFARDDGRVGIGTTSPAAALDVNGNAVIRGNLTATTVVGAVYQDVAEWVPATSKMTPGTVVVLNREHGNEVMPSARAYDTAVAGVVSEHPGLILGEAGEAKARVATTGRVKVKVDATEAPVKIGDLLVTSDRPGYAMKSQPLNINGRNFHQPGTVVGKALEPLEKGTGEILVLLALQ